MKKCIAGMLTALILLSGCTKKDHFITDRDYRNAVNRQFDARKKLVQARDAELFGAFDKELTLQQEEALKFLYAYMPLGDLADYDGGFFLKNVNQTLEAREFFSWGKDIPEEIFRHFVLPVRVNNEDLDTSRIVFFGELKDRVKDLSIHEAALEVNHWCHEKVNYRGSDGRTSSPLATMRTSWGRCGEESTFTVAAMRSVGIPARQVYTPRWAHTDDNHAWVEVYVDGKWQYLGACEPEAELNRGWFSKPVKRAMMVHTNAFGPYENAETEIERNPLFTKINTLATYTETKQLTVTVTDANGKPVADAAVEFGLYNYAEFYPIVEAETGKNGKAQIVTGRGGLLVSARKDGVYGYAPAHADSTRITVSLTRKTGEEYAETFDIYPPADQEIAEVSSDRREENARRLQQEDSIRNAYIATFITDADAAAFARANRLDEEQAVFYLKNSFGNWREIRKYLEENAADPHVLSVLQTAAEKDWRDTPADVWVDHLKNLPPKGSYPDDVYLQGIVSPRIQLELIRPWRAFLKQELTGKIDTANMPASLLDWAENNITINEKENYSRSRISPAGTYKLKVTDRTGFDIFLVAASRALGFPARIDQATGNVLFYLNGNWETAKKDAADPSAEHATLTIENDAANPLKPEYFIHFSLQKIEDGKFRSLDYEGSGLFADFPEKLELEPGYYSLTTGHRSNDGNVAVSREFLNLKPGEQRTVQVTLRPLDDLATKYGTLNLDYTGKDMQGNDISLNGFGTGGMVIAFLEPAREPTRHIMVDIPKLKNEFDNRDGHFLFIIPESKLPTGFNTADYAGLPRNSRFLIDDSDRLFNAVLPQAGLPENVFLPLVIFVNPEKEITFRSTGYRIGIGDNLLKEMRNLP